MEIYNSKMDFASTSSRSVSNEPVQSDLEILKQRLYKSISCYEELLALATDRVRALSQIEELKCESKRVVEPSNNFVEEMMQQCDRIDGLNLSFDHLVGNMRKII